MFGISGTAVAMAAAAAAAAVKVHQANMAASAQRKAAADANNLQQNQYDTARADYSPYRDAGTAATNNLMGLMKDPNSITSDPGYQFGLNQGTTAVQRSAAGAGGLYSGATLKALQRYGTDYAGTKLNDAYTRYGNVAQLGLNATNGTTAAGTNNANQQSANLIGAGNATAAQQLANGTSIGNGINQMASIYGDFISQKPPESTSSYGGIASVMKPNDLRGNNGWGGTWNG